NSPPESGGAGAGATGVVSSARATPSAYVVTPGMGVPPLTRVPTFPAQHHPVAIGASPPHLRRGAFRNSPPESGGAGAGATGVVSSARATPSANVVTPGMGVPSVTRVSTFPAQ